MSNVTYYSKIISKAWSIILEINAENISSEDNFFDLGGNSIKAIKIVNLLKRMVALEIKIKDIYQYPTVKGLATLLCSQNVTNNVFDEEVNNDNDQYYWLVTEVKNKIREKNIEDVYPLSKIELGMLYHYSLDQSNYSEYTFLEFPISIDNSYLMDQILNKITAKHELLRCIYDIDHFSIPSHIIYNSSEFDIDYIYEDISKWLPEKQKIYIQNFAKREKKNGFNFDKPLWRIRAFQICDSKLVVLLVFHHALLDGWSIEIFSNEIIECYHKMVCHGTSNGMEKLKSTYKNFILEQDEIINNNNLKMFWQNELKDLKKISLKEDKDKSILQNKKTCIRNFNKTEISLVEKVSKNLKIEKRIIYLASVICGLNMFSYENDFLVGIIDNIRPECEDSEKVIGCFINTVPLRVKIKPEITYEGLLKMLNEKVIELKKYGRLPFSEVCKCGAEQFSNLIDITFNYVEFNNVYFAEDETSLLDDINTNTKLDIIFDGTRGLLKMNISYDIGINSNFIKKLEEYIYNSFQQIIYFNHNIIYKDEIMSLKEKEFLINKINNTQMNFPSTTVQALFDEQVKKTPSKIAVVCGKNKITYYELYKRANNIGILLRRMGVKRNDVVSIFLERSIDMVASILGVLKAGAAFIPIDRSTPIGRIDNILSSSNCKIVITNSYLENVNRKGCANVFLDLEELNSNDVELYNINNPNDLAYVIYTSGTTGNPKGVMIEHQSLINLCYWNNMTYGVTQNDKFAKYANFGFDVSVWEIVPYIIAGAELHIIKEDLLLEMEELNRYYEDNQISLAYLPTPICEVFMEIENKSLRYLLTAGDKLRKFTKQNYLLANDYGPTETTVIATGKVINKEYDNIPIGKPISNTQVVVVDCNGQLQPIGVEGELCVGGTCLARGYFNDEHLTKEKFVFSRLLNNNRIYKTGDLSRILETGDIEFLGRNDRQIKLRGYRIELQEIENVIKKYAEIKQAIVIKNSKDELIAFYKTNSALDVNMLKKFLGKEIPSYMIPIKFYAQEEIPLTANGKIDYSKLVQQDDRNIDNTQKPIVESSNLKSIMKDLWIQILQKDDFGNNDNFFLIGGDSIKALQFIAKINAYGFDVRMNQFLGAVTIDLLYESIVNNENVKKNYTATEHNEIELSPIQKWFVDSNFRNPTYWNQSIILHMKMRLERSSLIRVVKELLDKHELLRAVFDINKMYLSEKNISEYYEMYNLEEDVISEFYIANLVEKQVKSMQLNIGPLFKIIYIQNMYESYLCLIAHHLIIDSISCMIIIEDIVNLIEKRQLSLLPEIDTYYDYVSTIRNMMGTMEENAYKKYWESQVNKEYYILPKKIGFAKNNVVDMEQKKLTFEFDSLDKAQYKFGVNIEEILIAALAYALDKIIGKKCYQIMLEQHGRNISEKLNLARTVGWFTNIVPLILTVPDELEVIEVVLANVKSSIEETRDNALGYVLDNYKNNNYLAENFSMDILFNYMGMLDNSIISNAFEICNMDDSSMLECNTYESLSIQAFILKKELSVEIKYSRKVYEESIIEKLVENINLFCNKCIEKNVLSTRKIKINSEINKFTVLFFRDCYYQAIIHSLLYQKRNINLLFANTNYKYIEDDSYFGMTISESDMLPIDELLSKININISYEKKVDDFNLYLQNRLKKDTHLVINVDCFYLPYKSDFYKQKHWAHCILAIACNQNEVVLIDNLADVFNLNYQMINVNINDIKDAYIGYNKNFNLLDLQKSITILIENDCNYSMTDDQIKEFSYQNIKKMHGLKKDFVKNKNKLINKMEDFLTDVNLSWDIINQVMYFVDQMLINKKIENYKIEIIYGEVDMKKINDKIIKNLTDIKNAINKFRIKGKEGNLNKNLIFPKWLEVIELECQYCNYRI